MTRIREEEDYNQVTTEKTYARTRINEK